MDVACGHAIIIPISKLSCYLASFLPFFSYQQWELLENEHRAAVDLSVKLPSVQRKDFQVMDARNQTAGCTVERFLRKTSPNQWSIETNTLHLQHQKWFCQEESTQDSPHTAQNCDPAQSLISLWFVVQLHKKGGQTPSQAPGILLCHNRWEACRPQSHIGQLQRVQWDITPSSKRSRLFGAVLETPSLDLHHIFSSVPQQRFSFPLSQHGFKERRDVFVPFETRSQRDS